MFRGRVGGMRGNDDCFHGEPIPVTAEALHGVKPHLPSGILNTLPFRHVLRSMQRSQAVVSSRTGLNVILATRLATAAMTMRSVVFLKSGGHVAEARNTLSVLGLCATPGSTIDIEASGEDEQDAAELVGSILSDPAR